MPREARRFRHITFRRTQTQSGWLVQYRGRTHGGFHATQEEAARTLRDAMKLATIAQLPQVGRQRPAVPRGKASYHGVTYHAGLGRYVVNDVVTGSTFANARDAATARSQAMRANPSPTPRKPGPKEIVARMRRLRPIYLPRGAPPKLPADLLATLDHARKSKLMFRKEPAAEILSIQLKYGPWKDALLEAWTEHHARRRGAKRPLANDQQVPDVNDRHVKSRAAALQKVLCRTAEMMARDKCPNAWSTNCGRFVGRHSAPPVVLQHLGILAKGGALTFRAADAHAGGIYKLMRS